PHGKLTAAARSCPRGELGHEREEPWAFAGFSLLTWTSKRARAQMVSVPPMKRWAALVLVLVVSGCGGKKSVSTVPAGPAPTPTPGAAPWPAPQNPMALTRKAGLTPETHEFVFLHVHAHLDVFVNGAAVTVPAAIGININDPAVKRIQEANGSVAYGGIRPPCARVCISPLHTHDTTGILHTEAK